jgi:hypothetical protein
MRLSGESVDRFVGCPSYYLLFFLPLSLDFQLSAESALLSEVFETSCKEEPLFSLLSVPDGPILL